MTFREGARYLFWGLVGCGLFLLAIITAPIWLPGWGLIRVGRSFYHEVVE